LSEGIGAKRPAGFKQDVWSSLVLPKSLSRYCRINKPGFKLGLLVRRDQNDDALNSFHLAADDFIHVGVVATRLRDRFAPLDRIEPECPKQPEHILIQFSVAAMDHKKGVVLGWLHGRLDGLFNDRRLCMGGWTIIDLSL
jgi:hypothetical protein